MFEIHETENIKNSRLNNAPRSGTPRKSSLPRRVGTSPHGNARTTVKRSSSLDGKTRQKPTVQKRTMNGHAHQRERAGSDSSALSERKANFLASLSQSGSKTQSKFGLRRSYSDNDLSISKGSSPSLQHFPLRKSNSWASLITENHEAPSADSDKKRGGQPKRSRGGIPKPQAHSSSDSSFNPKPGLRRWPNDGKIVEPMNRKSVEQASPTHRKYVESKANKIEAREKALREEKEKDRSPTKGPRGTLRRTRSASEYDRKQQNGNGDKPKGILLKSQSLDEPDAKGAASMPRKNSSQGVKINGVFVNKGKENASGKSPDKKKVKDVKKSVEENEKEGARNFARCLLGILPSVLSLSDPVAVDEALQQFASDVCEAVTCMALKRKNVPNFGTLRGRSDLVDEKSGEGAMSDPSFPILNADGVYVTVYATMTLNLKLLKSGYYQKKTATPALAQVGKKIKRTAAYSAMYGVLTKVKMVEYWQSSFLSCVFMNRGAVDFHSHLDRTKFVNKGIIT